MKLVVRSLVLAVALTAVVWVALFHPPLWQPTSAQDHLGRGGNMAVLSFLLALLLRRILRWPLLELMLGIVWAPLVAYAALGPIGGLPLPEGIGTLNQNTVLTLTLFLGFPWVFGVLVGSLLLQYTDKFVRRTA